MPEPMTATAPRGETRPSSTSSAVQTFFPSIPGSGGTSGSAPQATKTPQGEIAATLSTVARRPRRVSIPAASVSLTSDLVQRVIFSFP